MAGEPWLYICLLALFLISFKYVFVPQKIKASQTVSVDKEMSLVDVENSSLVPEARELFGRSNNYFTQQGFKFCGLIQVRQPGSQNVSYNGIFTDDAKGRLASFTSILVLKITKDSHFVRHTMGMGVETFYSDGTVLQSNTSPRFGIYHKLPGYSEICFHGLITDPEVLFQQHRAMEVQRGHGDTRPSGASNDPIGLLKRQIKEMMAYQVTRGLYELDEKAALYRLTTKGAYLITWKMLFPWKQLIRRGARREALRCIADTKK